MFNLRILYTIDMVILPGKFSSHDPSLVSIPSGVNSPGTCHEHIPGDLFSVMHCSIIFVFD